MRDALVTRCSVKFRTRRVGTYVVKQQPQQRWWLIVSLVRTGTVLFFRASTVENKRFQLLLILYDYAVVWAAIVH